MHDTSFSKDDVDAAESFLKSYYRDQLGELLQKYPEDMRSIEIDWADIYSNDPNRAEQLREHPDRVIDLFESALKSLGDPVDMSLTHAQVRVSNLPESATYDVGEYRAEHHGNYLAVNGQVSKSTPVKPRIEEAAFECQRCGALSHVPQTTGEFHEPHECSGCERQGPFNINFDQSDFTDHQLVRVTLPPEKASGQSTTIDVHFEGDMVNSIQPGDRADIAGKLQFDQEESGKQKKATFDYYLEGRSAKSDQTAFEDIDVDDHLDEIQSIANGEYGDPYEVLKESLAPKIHGYEDIKESIILQLFGGVRCEYPDGSVDRGDPHILLLGDPGTAKSSLLRAVEELSPRSTYASGKGASAAGMTAAVVADDFGEDKFSLEAGALVLAHEGVACVDEIDKIKDDARSSLHDALESQRVNINKAGINATLPAETAMLAAGNPKYGRFDLNEPIASQFDLGPTLLSRFDLKFAIQDNPSESRDRELVEHMTESRSLANKYTHNPEDVDEDELLAIEPDVDPDVFRAYIAYAKQNVFPNIEEDGVHEMIHDGYVNLRSNGYDDDSPIPLTARNVEAVERLAEASARVELRDHVTAEDVDRAQRLMFSSLQDVGIDPETGEFDVDIVETGTSKSQHKKIQKTKALIKEVSQETDGHHADIEHVLELAEETNLGRSVAEHNIEKLKEQGDVYEPNEGKVEVV